MTPLWIGRTAIIAAKSTKNTEMFLGGADLVLSCVPVFPAAAGNPVFLLRLLGRGHRPRRVGFG